MPVFFYETTIGKIGLAEEDGQLTHCFFASDKMPAGMEVKETPVLRRAKKQLEQYLNGARQKFELPLKPNGSHFALKVWQALLDLPFGKVVSYGQLAKELALKPGAARAVGQANHNNPLPIFIPCHRVIGANGKLTGYRGGLPLKRKLLELEGVPRTSK